MITLPIAVHIWVTLGFIGLAAVLFAAERLPTEVSALGLLCALLVWFQVFPLLDPAGVDLMPPERLLAGFANPALAAVLALLVIGEGLVQTDALNAVGRIAGRFSGGRPWLSVCVLLALVATLSGFINNTPLVIIFIPILQAVGNRLRLGAGSLMMPLSFATILGGMTTLIGSSTNLLVSSSLIGLGRAPLGLFEVTPLGATVAVAGLLYIFFMARRLLPERKGAVGRERRGAGKHFIAQVTVGPASRLVGARPAAGMLRELPDLTLKVLQRGEHAYTAPVDGVAIRPGDVLVVVGTRDALTEAMAKDPGLVAGDAAFGTERREDQILVEAMVVPNSPLVGNTLETAHFRHDTHLIVIGIRRHAQIIRRRITEVPLHAGDVLLVQGAPGDLRLLRQRHEVVVLEGTVSDLQGAHQGGRAALIFGTVVGLAALGILPIVLAAILGAVAMVVTGVLTQRQAARAIDRRIIMLVGSALALGEAMEATGAATALADGMLGMMAGASPAVVLSAFFALVMAITNVLSNNACAVLFTPIAVGLADRLGVDPHLFAIAVLIAADGCFASPIGYQTNLLVMGPGRYTFADFVRFGLPLSVLVWLVFTLAATWLYGL